MADQVAAHVLADHDASQGLCTLTLNRPGKSNALNAELVDALLQALERCSLDNTRVLVVTGAGKNFCGGFDFTDYERQSEGDLLQRFVRIELLLQRLRRAPFVTIAAVSGAAFGAGADIAAACTFRLARPQSRFRFPGFRFGVALGTRYLTALLGAQGARSVLLADKTLGAEEAEQIGLVTHVLEASAQTEFIETTLGGLGSLGGQAAADILRLTVENTDDVDLADLVRSVNRPGLHSRVAQYRQEHA